MQPVGESVTEKQFLLKTGQEEFEKLCWLDVFGTNSKDTETTKDKTIHVDFLQLLQKTPNEIALKSSYSASYKQDPVSSSTQQHKKNIRENRKTTEVPPDNAGTRADGIME